MQAKISAGTDCLRFLRVTGGNLPAPAGNSHEVFIVRIRADIFEPRDVFLSSSKHLDHSNQLLPLKSMVNPSNLILFQKRWSVPCWLVKPLSKRKLAEKVFTTIKMIGNWLLSLKFKEETTLKWILSGYIKKTQSNLNPKIGEVKAQVLQCTF